METCCRSIEDDLRVAHRLILARQKDGKAPKQAVQLLATRLRLAEAYVAKQSDARALRSYNRGLVTATVYSIAVLVAIAAAAWLLLRLIYNGVNQPTILLALYQTLVAIGGGAVGAMVSVMLRKVTDIADVDDDTLAKAALRRVVLGWIFAAALVFLIKGQILNVIKLPADTDDRGIVQWFFWGGIGFLAGFNERWVRQLISRTPDTDEPARPDPHAAPVINVQPAAPPSDNGRGVKVQNTGDHQGSNAAPAATLAAEVRNGAPDSTTH
jgi:hypothetical protein